MFTSGGEQAALQCVLDAASPVTAVIVGTEARIEIGSGWYGQADFRLIATDGTVPEESVAIMGTLDEVRRQIGLRFPGE